MSGYLIFILGFAIGVAIFACVAVLRETKNNKHEHQVMTYQEGRSIEFDELNNRNVISSDKIRKLKEKELREKELKAQAVLQKENNKESKKDVGQSANSNSEEQKVVAGEVQRSEKEQFNLRKDEKLDLKAEEDGKWWI